MATVLQGTSGGYRGKVGNEVFVQTAGGTVVREYVIPRNPRTPAQQAHRERWRRASLAWSEIDQSSYEAWVDYANSLSARNPATGITKSPRPNNLFCVLYSKVLAINLAAPAPNPPSAPFFGDHVSVSAAASPGEIVFTANRANESGIVTEILLQGMANGRRRTYPDKYRSQGFVAFTPEHLSEAIAVKPGWYACAYRFVNAETGQETSLAAAGNLRVG